MRSLVVLSGKGGVGKSTVAASLTISLSRHKKVVCADCDVDASNLALVFGIKESSFVEFKPLSTNQMAQIDTVACNGCGICVESCYFSAMGMKDSKAIVERFGCEGCGVCEIVCPQKAVSLVPVFNANIGWADTGFGFPLAFAQLIPGSSGSGKTVTEVRRKAEAIARDAELMVIDAAAGIGCPVIASVAANDYALLVTEPTPSAFSDLKKALDLVDSFHIRRGLVINRFDLSDEMCGIISAFAKGKGMPILAMLPFDKAFVEAMAVMQPIIRFQPRYQRVFDSLAHKLLEELT